MPDKHDILSRYFGYGSFRPGQEQAIDAILGGSDVLAVMPTGAGKSICYQIPALLLPGMSIVISPLISLMKDQVNALCAAGCPAAFLNSSLTGAEYGRTMRDIRSGRIKLLYIAPERLQRSDLPMPEGQDAPPLVVIDEAHCVSHWGHDFRTSYLGIADFVQCLKPRPTVAAFTATATPQVKEDIRKMLGLSEPVMVSTGFDRPNLYFGVKKPANKKNALLTYVKERSNQNGIVYCSTRKNVDEIHELLTANGVSAGRYHAGLGDEERRQNQDDFLYDRKTVMVATNAFGMGIDKSNVGYVVHFNMPKNIESYYQEAGRAGRDGNPADCMLLFNGQDVHVNEYLISGGDDSGDCDPALLAHNRELLRQMTFYATGSDCLRSRLLGYFGEKLPGGTCGNCSNCLAEYEKVDVSLEARKIISCIYRLKQRNLAFGKTTIADILKGSRGERILRMKLDTLSVWGIMKDTSARQIREIVDFMVEDGCLLARGEEYPVIVLGPGCQEILEQKRPLQMKLRKDRDRTAKTELPLPTSYVPGLETDLTLLNRLKELRKRFAMDDEIPSYIVFTDATLREMARRKPTTLTEFAQVKGVGQVKLDRFGSAFLRVIREYMEEQE